MDRQIIITDKQLKKELAIAEKEYDRNQESWRGNEAMGRVLYWMNDQKSVNFFRKATTLRSSLVPASGSFDLTRNRHYIALGNYCRMSGDLEQSYKFLNEGYQQLKEQYDKIKQKFVSTTESSMVNFNVVRNLLLYCFMLKRYDEAVDYGAILRQYDSDYDPEHLHEQFILLAEAKLIGDLEKALKAVDGINWIIKSERVRLYETGYIITLWDAYDMALHTVDELQEPME